MDRTTDGAQAPGTVDATAPDGAAAAGGAAATAPNGTEAPSAAETWGDVPIAPARLKRAKRTGIVLVIVIVLLFAALAALAYLAYTIYRDGTALNSTVLRPVPTITEVEVTDPDAPSEVKVEETSIPDLVSLFGLTVEKAKARLGTSFKLARTDAATDESNPAVRQLATFSYTPSVTGGSSSTATNVPLPSESIYASLDEEGRVIDIYYVCDMQLLGYPERSFDELLADSGVVTGSLASAGVQPRDFSYVPPDPVESIVYDNPNSANRKVVKQSQIFSGRTTSETVPTVWTLTVTYDFGSGVSSADQFREAGRTIHLKLA
ncbi:MAG: hypothetical protein LBL86_02905 [Coriobacteriales bacterium]|jgi:hypothetical protein|nr:hypothetical protein [Coriobacteriales bacterium]